MSNSRPLLSLSVDSRKLRTGDQQPSPESEEDAKASPPSADASEADVPPSPDDQDQDDVNMGASSPSEGGASYGLGRSSSTRSGNSYGMDSSSDSPLPDDTDEFGASASLSRQVQGQGSESTLPKVDGTLVLEGQESTSRRVLQEVIEEDLSQPVETETGDLSVAQEDARLDVPPSAEGGSSAVRSMTHPLLL